MLHVLNGGATRVTAAGIPGEAIVWADVLHDGPVPDEPPAALQATRAAHLAAAYHVSDHQLRREFERREALDHFDRHDEVVFWLEHDLYDQLLLLRHLHWLSGIDRGRTRFSLVCRDEYLGPSSPERLRTFFQERRPVSEDEVEAGREGWNQFRSTDPRALVAWAASDQCRRLEFMSDALRRLFEEFPWESDGLSRTERQALSVVRGGAKTLSDAFVASQAMEERIFMGDLGFWDLVHRLEVGPQPLLAVVPPMGASVSGRELVALTDGGRLVLDGKADAVALNGIDRWIGGVHLTPNNCWRWTGALLVS